MDRTEEDPASAHVTSMNRGSSLVDIRSIRVNRLSSPASVFGGKNSKE